MLLCVAGNETTRNAISHGMHALLEHPDAGAGSSSTTRRCIDGAIEEILRWASPVMYFRRTTTKPVTIGGVDIPEDEADRVLAHLRQPRRGRLRRSRTRFDITRSPNPHSSAQIAFGGGGPHFCLGANLARAEMKVTFEALLPHLGTAELRRAAPAAPLQLHQRPQGNEGAIPMTARRAHRPPTDHYTIISSDCHAGASHAAYREYLDPAYLEDFDAWRNKYKNPYKDLAPGDDRRLRNWDNEMRNGQQEADGIVGEVVFPNTVPPFFPSFVLFAPPPPPEEYEHRLAGIRAHNRWLKDWCDEFPERRAGVGQIFLNDIDDAIEDATWIKENGLRGGILLPADPARREVGEAALRPRVRPAVEGARGPRDPGQRPRRHRRARLRQVPDGDAALHRRGVASTRSGRSCSSRCRASSTGSRGSSS